MQSKTADTVYNSVKELKAFHAWQPTISNISDVIGTPNVKLRMRAVKAMTIAKNKLSIIAFTALCVSDFNRLSEVNLQDRLIRADQAKEGH